MTELEKRSKATTSSSVGNISRKLNLNLWAGCIFILLAVQGGYLWFYFIAPYNILFRLVLLLLTMISAICLFLPRFRKAKLCIGVFSFTGLLFLATPVTWDDRLAALRYSIQIEYFPKSLGIEATTRILGFPSSIGEKLEIERWQIPGHPKYEFKEVDDGGCFLQMANVSSNFVLRYGVCPSGTGALWISKFFLRFW